MPVADLLPGLAVTLYCVIVLPPLEAGGEKETTTRPLAGATVTLRGAPGGPFGVAGGDVTTGPDPPVDDSAWIVNVYVVPFVSWFTVADVAVPTTLLTIEPGMAVTTYLATRVPLPGAAVQVSVTDWEVADRVIPLTDPGTRLCGVTAADCTGEPVPTALRAATRNTYEVPLVSPEKVAVVASPARVCVAAPVVDTT